MEQTYLSLTRVDLPRAAAAASPAWPIALDHCFMRVVLDHAVGRRWDEIIDRRRGPAYRQIDDATLRAAIVIARSMLAEGVARVRSLNERSLAMRGGSRRSP